MAQFASAPQFAAESGHWYTLAGEPRYEIVGKNGRTRPTTLRDAREHKLVPSVTTIIKCAAAPGLERWKAEQLMMAALTLPRQHDEPEEAWLDRVRRDSREQARKAADRGTAIHGAIECAMRGQPYAAEYAEHVHGALESIPPHSGVLIWHAERSFAHPLGYGGKCDLHCDAWVLDYKTKEFDDCAAVRLFDDHAMQLAAYRRGLMVPQARCGILFVSTLVPGLSVLHEVPEPELQRGLAMFDHLLGYWQCQTGHRP